MTYLGDRLGLYKAMADGTPVTSEQLAAKTGTAERYIRDWLVAQAAAGIVEYDAATGAYRLPPEQALALTDENSPVFLGGAFEGSSRPATPTTPGSRTRAAPAPGSAGASTTTGCSPACERFFRPGYAANLVGAWLPALDGVVDKLQSGASVADVGCGLGASTIIMAQAFPGPPSSAGQPRGLDQRRAQGRGRGGRGPADQVRDPRPRTEFPGTGYDLVCMFDCLHDMGDPLGAARHARQALAPDGTLLLVEPMAGDGLEENLNPVGRIYSSASRNGVHAKRSGRRRQGAGYHRQRRCPEGGLHQGRFGRFRPGDRDAIQPGVRGPQVTRDRPPPVSAARHKLLCNVTLGCCA